MTLQLLWLSGLQSPGCHGVLDPTSESGNGAGCTNCGWNTRCLSANHWGWSLTSLRLRGAETLKQCVLAAACPASTPAAARSQPIASSPIAAIGTTACPASQVARVATVARPT